MDDDLGTTNRGGKPSSAIRWTIERASMEFGIDRKNLTKRIRVAGIPAGVDHKWSTLEICSALYEHTNPRDEKEAAQAENFRLRNEELRRTRIPIDIVVGLWDAVIQAFSATLKAAKGQVLTAEKINELLSKLRGVKLPTKWKAKD